MPRTLTAQAASAWLDAGAASARPPAGITAATASYGLLGARTRLESTSAGALDVFARAGRGADGETAQWVEGEAAWELGRAGRHAAWGLRASGFGLDYQQPFDYRALGVALEPSVSVPLGATVLALRGDIRHGSWKLAAPDTASGDSAGTGRLALEGAALSMGRLLGPVWVEVGAEGYRGALDGWFTGGFASARWVAGPVDLGLSGRAWSTPAGSEVGVTGGAGLALGAGFALRAEVGRDTRDPLYGTPGSFGGSVAVSLRLAHATPAGRPNLVAELGPARGDGRIARFRLHAPRAHAVGLAGDFTDWRPRPLVRDGEDWVLELTLGPGLHHFAFVVDGRDWTVPRDAPGVAADEWGRQNATLVIEM